jgi:MFS family permease
VESPISRPLPGLARLAPGVFYGWLIALGAGALSFACVGVGFYSVSLFLDALVREHGWSKAAVSGASSLYFLVVGGMGTLVGRGVDRHGGRAWIAAGACTLALGLGAVGWLREPWQLWPTYALMAIGFAMCSSVPTAALLSRWFVRKRSRAMAITYTGVSLGGIVVVPIATWLIETRGLRVATGALALVVLAIALPVTAWVLRWDPGAHGLEPDGGIADPVDGDAPWLRAQRREWSARQAMATRSFWLLALAFSIVLFGQVGMLVHEIALVRERLDAASAAFALSLTAAGSLIGRLCLGPFADRLEKRRLCVALFALQSAALVAFSFASTRAGLLPAAFAFGLTVGNVFMMQSLLAGELFGIPSFGTVFGMLQMLTQVASGFGPLAVGLLYAASGSYALPLRTLAATALLAAFVVARVRAPTPALPAASS